MVGEREIAVARVDSFFAFAPIGVVALLALATILILPTTTGATGQALAIVVTIVFGVPVAVVLALRGFLAIEYSRFTLTNKRVVVRTGMLSRRTRELLLHRVESIHLQQGAFGRLVGYGTVVVRGTGGLILPMVGLRNAQGFRQLIEQQVEETATPR